MPSLGTVKGSVSVHLVDTTSFIPFTSCYVRILNSEDPETTFLRQNNVPAVGFQESLVFASEIATKCWKRSLRCMYPCESSVIVHYAREHLCELKHGFLRLP
ncbi:hypothetical protein Y032_0016g3075 [Ancylostoma ceylanicum]|uniref:Uncharacterized protein n=1 Tax=Ancylostoma ceylanicum TaxID=53326 RepID=A0A016V7P0_9BILA|nr:hypothetical protein Y032_0016g3075 [Ancylostoma ceylanicum]